MAIKSMKRAQEQIAAGRDPNTIILRPSLSRRNTRIMLGLENLDDWDEEELRMGCRRMTSGPRKGQFGKRPEVIPKAIHDEMMRRTLSKAHMLLAENTVDAVQTLVDIMHGEDVDDAVRLRAAVLIIERMMGKPKETIDVNLEAKPYQTTLDKIFTSGEGIIDVPSNEA